MNVFKSIVAAAAALSVFAAEAGTTYKFSVFCQSKGAHVEVWETGDIDPGYEYLRVATGVYNPGCGVERFQPQYHSGYPVVRHSDAGGVIDGIAPVKKFLEALGIRW